MVTGFSTNPLDGLKIIGKYVKEIHAKDGKYPTNPNELVRRCLFRRGK